MKSIELIKQFLERIFKFSKDIDTNKITKTEIINLFKKYNLKRIRILDRHYKLINKKEIEKFLKSDNVSFNKYKKEIYDCDDFALVLLGRIKNKFHGASVGLAISKTHAFNFFIDENKKVWIIEPQTDKIINPNSKLKTKYQIREILI